MPRAALITAVVGLLLLPGGEAQADRPVRRTEKTVTKRSAVRRPAGGRLRAGKAAPGGTGRRGKARPEPRAARRARIAAYRASVVRWQTPTPGAEVHWRDGARDVTLRAVNTGESVTVWPFRADGTPNPEAAAGLRRILRDHRSDSEHEVEPRLVTVLYRLLVALDAPEINLISGFREPRRRGHSLHGEGQAIDFVVPGVELERVVETARGLGHVGVGLYPTSGFVHLDVRDRSYFWIDRSGPGQRGRGVQVRPEEARAADAAYRPEQDRIVARPDGEAVTVGVSPSSDQRPRSAGPAGRSRAHRRRGTLRAGHR